MHELTVAQRLVDRATEAATNRGADRVDRLTVELGEATHLAADQLAFCLTATAEGTPAEDATISFEHVEPAGECDCGWSGRPERLPDTVPAAPSLRCPECAGRLTLTAGRECRLASIEVPPSGSAREAGGSGAGPDGGAGRESNPAVDAGTPDTDTHQ